MSDGKPTTSSAYEPATYDVAIVGASLAGCAAAILLGRAGLSVALIEQRLDPGAFKRTCSHFIQASAVPTLDRLDLLGPIMAAGGVRTPVRAWTRWGWIEAPPEQARLAVNLRRERLDPLIRERAGTTPGVELMLGLAVHGLIREDGAFRGVRVRDPQGNETALRTQLVVGADGRDSRVAELAGVATKTLPHGRFAYGAYFEGPPAAPRNASSVWLRDPQWAAAFPTDEGLVFYAAMLTKDRLPEFRRDLEDGLISFLDQLPDPPPVRVSRRVSPVIGKLEMPTHIRAQVAPGLALAGDAALAVDPLFGVGCGWAVQSAEWLATSVAPALRGEESLSHGLRRYRRRHSRELRGHAVLINGYASGRRHHWGERALFVAAARDPRLAAKFDAVGTRSRKPGRTLARILPRVLAVNAREALRRRRRANERAPAIA